jgi:hypothetical protein
VSDRDFALDYLMAATQCSLHLSRLAEELIIWASQMFGFVRSRRIFDRLLDHAAEAQPRRGRAGARPFRPDRRAQAQRVERMKPAASRWS